MFNAGWQKLSRSSRLYPWRRTCSPTFPELLAMEENGEWERQSRRSWRESQKRRTRWGWREVGSRQSFRGTVEFLKSAMSLHRWSHTHKGQATGKYGARTSIVSFTQYPRHLVHEGYGWSFLFFLLLLCALLSCSCPQVLAPACSTQTSCPGFNLRKGTGSAVWHMRSVCAPSRPASSLPFKYPRSPAVDDWP